MYKGKKINVSCEKKFLSCRGNLCTFIETIKKCIVYTYTTTSYKCFYKIFTLNCMYKNLQQYNRHLWDGL